MDGVPSYHKPRGRSVARLHVATGGLAATRPFPIFQTVSGKLSWSHYLELLKLDDEKEISFRIIKSATPTRAADFCNIISVRNMRPGGICNPPRNYMPICNRLIIALICRLQIGIMDGAGLQIPHGLQIYLLGGKAVFLRKNLRN